MDHQDLFHTVCGHRNKASCNLHQHQQQRHHSNHTSPGPSDHFQSSPTSVAHSTGPVAPPTSSSSSVPRGLPANHWHPSSSVASTSSASCSSTPTHTTNRHFTHSTLSSPVSFDSNSHRNTTFYNGITCASVANSNYYVPIANSSQPHFSQSLSAQYANLDLLDVNLAAVNNTATMHPPTGIVINDEDMKSASYYCFDRGDGQFTPLVPLDQLPAELLGFPARVASDENMIVLPEPRLAGDVANNQALAKFAELAVTSRIDDIIAHAPNRQSALVLARNAKSHALVAAGGKREKIYCDKWIHDGTCAFTQQGCKFKHEMPGDRETQQSLGLFHGYPAWWKKKCAEENMPIDDRPVHVGGGGGGGIGNNGGAGGVGGGQGYRNIVGRLGAPTPTAGAHHGNNNHHHADNNIGTASSALASNNWRQRAEAALGSQSPEMYEAPTVTTPMSGGSNSSGGTSRAPWQPRSRAVGGSVQGRGAVARYNMPHFAQPNFGPIAPPSQTAIGFNTPGRGRRNTNNDTDTATPTAFAAASAVPTASPAEHHQQQQQQQHDGGGGGEIPSMLGNGFGGGVPRRTATGGSGGSLPLRGGAPLTHAASSEDTEFSTNTNQSTDEMGNASGVKL